MKRNLIILGIFTIALIGFVYAQRPKEGTKEVVLSQTQTVKDERPLVSIVIDDNAQVASFAGISAHTAFEALTNIASATGMTVKTKQYDFGVFVEQIGDKPNTKNLSWVYLLNDKSGTVAADRQQLETGDTVTWRYTKPLY